MNNPDLNLIGRIGQKVNKVLLLVSFFALAFVLIPVICFAQNHQNDWFYNPFNQHSAHHRPVGTGAIYADENHPAIQDWLMGSHININVGDRPWGLYMVDADEEGPLLKVNRRRETGVSGLPVKMRFPAGGGKPLAPNTAIDAGQ